MVTLLENNKQLLSIWKDLNKAENIEGFTAEQTTIIRDNFIFFRDLMIEANCFYDYAEKKSIEDTVPVISNPVMRNEIYNEKHFGHGIAKEPNY